MRAFAFGFCGRELERMFEHRAGPVVGDKVRGAVGVLQFRVVGVVVEVAEDIGADVGVISPGQDACRRAEPVAPVGTCQAADGRGLDEVAVGGGARSCSGWFAELGDEISTSCAEKAFRSDVKPGSMWRASAGGPCPSAGDRGAARGSAG